jgi:hypothetical protein
MIHIVVQNEQQELATIHDGGPLEFGRAAGYKTARIVVNDLHSSRDHLRIEETGDGKLRVRNLSKSSPVTVENDELIEPDETRVVPLPEFAFRWSVGHQHCQFQSGSSLCAPTPASWT